MPGHPQHAGVLVLQALSSGQAVLQVPGMQYMDDGSLSSYGSFAFLLGCWPLVRDIWLSPHIDVIDTASDDRLLEFADQILIAHAVYTYLVTYVPDADRHDDRTHSWWQKLGASQHPDRSSGMVAHRELPTSCHGSGVTLTGVHSSKSQSA